jgi:hypothetical protein
MIELVQWKSFSRSASGTPIRSAMASSGRLIAMSSTKLPESFSAAAATISRAATASFSSSVATALGVKSRDTILRSRVCSGASWLISSALVSSS